jgi:hypothetical protein
VIEDRQHHEPRDRSGDDEIDAVDWNAQC